jgi:alpha/beta superfamily hydrolase
MLPVSLLKTPGSHPFFFEGKVGKLEAVLTVPENATGSSIALLGHPHSLYGGTMSNKVVTTLSRAFSELGIINIRFNFRGVGQSLGVFDAGVGESEDMVILADLCRNALPDCHFIFAGFSFGSYVTYRAALVQSPSMLISIAPPVHHFDYQRMPNLTCPWVVVQGTEDEVVPFSLVRDFSNQFTPPLEFISFEGASHFFHGKLILLRETIVLAVKQKCQFVCV